ncbi:MAG: DNA-directed RNA polymerase subunit alpha [Parcubacteria group bacterium CG2_30_36_18]|uniref:DNA-directed RNA polymerase subunit alpha n=3 Tax=Candidatus Nealsoniibacteriota TaxID=1817911 RepID=A0A2M8DLY8_9BACT|nr:MAG: DNA-directed RNA polymerase subunit alpha [Parcubacteria group bacterium CG2_30_36_18]PIP24760.1 MAG: DNA-directed RNA polymerase subunit alpha [Candidatus Nealsonbacteria bacterium CG23_combo_of_CG06-09_8_20_14_all_36_125]PIX88686.1 MAG: DNA-directed RNA polymerase subunit alpha [Candidatus Nealsonbacteria bacterium CG_4_10_14_3_um_filter_36_16]PJB98822.1 MAG: DNA-directed RNA polymerase subunit alpha [Candidatus Nealsonbacteria bacterium CG_4_9_14_0_8_um_filter_36_17]
MIPLPLQPKIIEKKGNYARFEIEALYPGYGVTIGNSLRRILLSSLEGAAVTQMKMKNVPHEFSTIPGVLEDVILIMLNLKQMRFRLYTQEPQKGFLKVKGEKEVKGSDFELPSQVELVNPDCHIATLTQKSSELEMEIQIEKGIGYSPKEARGREKLEIGTIPIDAIFTPVKRVAFQVENMRVGERTDFDRLFLEVETDGTISPEAAFSQTSEVLVKHFSLLAESFKEKAEILRAEIPVEKKKAKVAKKKTKRKKTTTGRHYTLHPPASGPIKGRKFSL